MNIEDLAARLDAVRRSGPDRFMARCPAHDDRDPSLSIREVEDQRILLHCFSGCSAAEVVSALGLNLSDIMPPRPWDIPGGPGGYPSMYRPHRQRLHQDALRVMAHEALIVAVAAERVATGDVLLLEDYGRVLMAAKRLQDAATQVFQ